MEDKLCAACTNHRRKMCTNFRVEYLTEGDHMISVDEDCEIILKVYQTN